jgi:hypothetical protein
MHTACSVEEHAHSCSLEVGWTHGIVRHILTDTLAESAREQVARLQPMCKRTRKHKPASGVYLRDMPDVACGDFMIVPLKEQIE